MDKKNFCLRDFGGDLSQRWFVQYKEDERWKKTYISAKLTTQEARNKKAKSIIAALQGKEVPKPLAYIEALRHVVEQRLLGARKKTKQFIRLSECSGSLGNQQATCRCFRACLPSVSVANSC